MERGSRRNPDNFKPLEEVLEPDRRQIAYVIREPGTGQVRTRTLVDHHATIAGFALNGNVPDTVRVHFETARNLLVYGWFAYRFIQVAEFHAFSTVEMTLRLRFIGENPGETPSLAPLLRMALDQGLIRDEGFSHFHALRARRGEYREVLQGPTPSSEVASDEGDDPLAYTRRIVDHMPYFRNVLAHGSPMLMPHGYLWLGTCCDLINQIYEPAPDGPESALSQTASE